MAGLVSIIVPALNEEGNIEPLFRRLTELARRIRENYGRLSSTSQVFAQQIDDKLQGLLQAYLRLLHAAWQHREYLRTTDLGAVQRELAQLQKAQQGESPRVQEINGKRIEITAPQTYTLSVHAQATTAAAAHPSQP